MDKKDFKELERLFYLYNSNPSKETGHELKSFLNYCSKKINIRKLKSRMIKF